MRKAYSYKRISSLGQIDGQGIERQEDSVNKWLVAHPDVELDTRFSFTDIAKSAFKGRHLDADSGLGMFLAAIENGQIEKGSYLLIEAFDRFGRDDVDDARQRMVTIIKAGVSIVTLMDGREHNESNRGDITYMITSLLQMHAAHDYSLKLQKRVGDAKRKYRDAAKDELRVMSHQAPSWLDIIKDKDGKEYFVHNKGAETVKLIFDMRANNTALTAITQFLNDNIDKYPVLTRQKKTKVWSLTTVRDVLKRPSVLGILPQSRLKDDNGNPKYPAVAGYYGEPVITLDLWNRVQALNVNGGGFKVRDFPHGINLFRGLIRCSECGTLTTINGCREGYHGSITCRKGAVNGCSAPRFNMRIFEDAVINRLLKNISTQKYDAVLRNNINKMTVQYGTLNDELSNLLTAMKLTKSPTLIQSFVKDMEVLEEKIANVEKELNSLKSQSQSKTVYLFRDLDLTTNEGRIAARGIVFDYVRGITINTADKTCDVFFSNGTQVKNFPLVKVVPYSEQTVSILESGYIDEWKNLVEDTKTVNFSDFECSDSENKNETNVDFLLSNHIVS